MKIAFTHNLRLSDSEEEAEFDEPATVAALTAALRRLGHDVEPIEVSGKAYKLVAALESYAPDLVFNTAEGRHGRFREAFYPALFDQLGLPYTGSDAWVCAVTLDKHLTKMLVAGHGVPTPRWCFIDDPHAPAPTHLHFPVIIKPNYEGSSKGITLDGIAEDQAGLARKLAAMLARYPSGVLVEEFIVGRDVVVPFLEKASPQTGGVLTAASYSFDPSVVAGRKYEIYDYELKGPKSHAVTVHCPAPLPRKVAAELAEISRTAFKALEIRDLGRLDFRVTDDGRLYFIEANALPSLEPGAGIYLSAARAGLRTLDAVLETILRSAAERQGLKIEPRKTGRRRPQVRVGLTYNLKRIAAKSVHDDDSEAEYDPQTTIDAIADAIRALDHEVVPIEATSDLPTLLATSGVDVVFNIAEGIGGRSREAQVPAILELLGIPYTGSDPATLSLAHDKGLAKRIVRQAGVDTPRFAVLHSGKERLPKELRYPVIVKPLAEGSSKGVIGKSVAKDEAEAREIAREIVGRYRQAALVEEFLPGREFTVAVLGETRLRVLPPMEIVYLDPKVEFPIYSFEAKLDWAREIRYDAPAQVDPDLRKRLEKAARTAFVALGCRDVARVDLRLDAQGKVCFIECNPLPGLTPGWSDLCLIAASAGLSYPQLIAEILAPALRRHREKARKAGGPAGTSPEPTAGGGGAASGGPASGASEVPHG